MLMSEIPVHFEEMHEGGTTEHLSPGQTTAQKKFKVAWVDRWAFYQACVGRVVVTGGYGGTIARQIPLQYPEAPWLYATQVDAEPLGVSTPGALAQQYDKAIITVTFSSVPFSFGATDNAGGFYSGVYRTESIEMSGEMLQLHGGLKFATDGYTVQHAPGVVLPQIVMSVKQHWCPYIPYTSLFAAIGTVNSQIFYGARKGCVMFLGCQSQAQYAIGQDYTQKLMMQELTMKFAYRTIPWGWVWRIYPPPPAPATTSGFDKVVTVDGRDLYAQFDHNLLMFDGTTPPGEPGLTDPWLPYYIFGP